MKKTFEIPTDRCDECDQLRSVFGFVNLAAEDGGPGRSLCSECYNRWYREGAGLPVVDCFKFRNKLGLDVALEALRLARQRKRVQNRELLHYARLLRVANPMSPYLQAIE